MQESRISVVVGVDGAGRTHRLARIVGDSIVTPITRSLQPDEAFHRTRDTRTPIIVDDAHRLPPPLLRAVTDGARNGAHLVITRRPTITSAELADLDALAASQGQVVDLAPLTETETARLIAGVTGTSADIDLAAQIHRAAAGLPVWAAALAADAGRAAIRARIARTIGTPESVTARVATILAAGLDLADDLLARVAEISGYELVAALQELAEAGVLATGTERLVPIVAEVLDEMTTPAQRRWVQSNAGRILTSIDPVVAANHLRRADATSPDAADTYARAGERVRFTDPAAAVEWFDLAVATGLDPAVIAPARVDADLLLGRPMDVDGPASGRGYAAGVAAAHAGRSGRAAELLSSSPPPGPLLAVLPLIADGRLDEARAITRPVASRTHHETPGNNQQTSAGPTSVRRLAEGAIALATDPLDALPTLIEAAETYEQSTVEVVFPDTPHAVAAVAAVTVGDSDTAEHLLERAIAGGIGGPAATDRHRLLLAWARMRSGRYDTAREEVRRLGAASLPGRERVLLAALAAGLARRSGEVSQLREAWSRAQPALGRRTVDLLSAEITEELVVAATRLREHHRVTPLLDDLDSIVARLGHPPTWQTTVAWLRLHIAIAADDADAAARAVDDMPATAPGPRQQAQRRAAQVWADALAGAVAAADVLTAADDLAAAHLPWEASRLCGHAAIRTRDPADTRRLLERARDLGQAGTAATGPTAPADPAAGLSEREMEVARMVLAGQTYKVIGAQLFLSPKTVEHHVARIRGKIGAETRAEMVAALRTLLG